MPMMMTQVTNSAIGSLFPLGHGGDSLLAAPAVVVCVETIPVGSAHAVHDASLCVPRPVAASAVAVHVGCTVRDTRHVSGAAAERSRLNGLIGRAGRQCWVTSRP